MSKKNIYLVLGAVFVLVVAGSVDAFIFKKNGGHNGRSFSAKNIENVREVARQWIEQKAPTYVFDGLNLVFIEERVEECSTCHVFTFSFESRQGGYGNREGLALTQVITPHKIEVEIKNGVVARAITDGKYNEITGAVVN